MGKNYLIILIAVGLMVSFAGQLRAPNSATAPASSDSHDAAVQSSSASSHSEPSFSQSSSGNELILERRDDGHFYADVEVNGVPISMLVDTGASAVALSADDARRAGIATTIGMHDVIGEGAGGQVHGDIVTIERIRLGGLEQSGVPAAVLKGGSMSLLGQSFLRDFDSVEIRGDQMHLR
ncbi:MAG: TIGR02281 family clan AA aspartic protease [Sphingomicrobium sp.]